MTDPEGTSAPSDATLVRQALGGSQAAYTELILRYHRPVLNLIGRLTGDRDQAEDLAQEAFLKAFRALRRYDLSRNWSSWLFSVAHHHAIDHLRRRRPATEPLDAGLGATMASATPSPEASLERQSLAEALEDALKTLRPEYRTAIVLHYQHGLTHQDIAQVLELPPGTVKTHLHRARKELAMAMTARGWGSDR